MAYLISLLSTWQIPNKWTIHLLFLNTPNFLKPSYFILWFMFTSLLSLISCELSIHNTFEELRVWINCFITCSGLCQKTQSFQAQLQRFQIRKLKLFLQKTFIWMSKVSKICIWCLFKESNFSLGKVKIWFFVNENKDNSLPEFLHL